MAKPYCFIGTCVCWALSFILLMVAFLTTNIKRDIYVHSHYKTGTCQTIDEQDSARVTCETSCNECAGASPTWPSCGAVAAEYERQDASGCDIVQDASKAAWQESNTSACATVALPQNVACTNGQSGCCGTCCAGYCTGTRCTGSGKTSSCTSYSYCCVWVCCETFDPEYCTVSCGVDHEDGLRVSLADGQGGTWFANVATDAGMNEAGAEVFMEEHRPGASYTCYFDPADPAGTVQLEKPTLPAGPMTELVFGCVFGFIGLLFLAGGALLPEF